MYPWACRISYSGSAVHPDGCRHRGCFYLFKYTPFRMQWDCRGKGLKYGVYAG
nr:MAG TPA: hypothetical protein [Caudoviricetes sp.]